MRRLALALIAAALLAGAGPGAASAQTASTLVGRWKTPDDDGVVEIFSCGPALCGRIVSSATLKSRPGQVDERNRDPALRKRPLTGLVFMTGFKGGPTRWTDGKIYRPMDGATYSGSLRAISPDRLELKGCVVAPLCQSQEWRRLTP